jgi:16S rRNA (adenine1518-N6/adenine1519-N6)-dimethyltransferase
MTPDKSLIIKILKNHRINPNRSLGQNFLVDREILTELVRQADLDASDVILEVGPGLGSLTKELAQEVRKVVAVELSDRLAKICQQECRGLVNIKIINRDILVLDLAELSLGQNYKVVSSLPYQITSPFLRKLITADQRPKLIVLLVQREVAERIVAQPKDSRRGFLSVLVQLFYQPEIIREVAEESFYPAPKVKSAILKLTPIEKNYLVKDPAKFFKLLQAGFGHKRKKLVNSLALNLKLDRKKISEAIKAGGLKDNDRAESLTIENWIELGQRLKSV